MIWKKHLQFLHFEKDNRERLNHIWLHGCPIAMAPTMEVNYAYSGHREIMAGSQRCTFTGNANQRAVSEGTTPTPTHPI